MIDLKLIGSVFFDIDWMPKEKEYLLRYCNNELQITLLVYYFNFKSLIDDAPDRGKFYRCFWDHTGYVCGYKTLWRHIKKIEWIEEIVQNKKKEGDIELIARIKSGNFKIKEMGNRDLGIRKRECL